MVLNHRRKSYLTEEVGQLVTNLKAMGIEKEMFEDSVEVGDEKLPKITSKKITQMIENWKITNFDKEKKQ